MDPRHELFEQELLNQFITLINHYMTQYTDDLLHNQTFLDEIKELAHAIFDYLQSSTDVEEILAKKNLLSIDVVTFPHLDDPTHDIFKVNDKQGLMEFIEKIHLITKKYATSSKKNDELNQSIEHTLHQLNLP